MTAATRSFFTAGFEGTAIENVAREAKVSKVTVYNYFESKESLFAAAVSSECDKIHDRIIISENSTLDIDRRLFAIGLAIVESLMRPEMVRFEQRIAAETSRFPKLGTAFLDAGPRVLRRQLAEMISSWEEKGEIRVPDCNLAAEQFVSMCKGLGDIEQRFGIQQSKAAIETRVAGATATFLKAYRVIDC